MDRPVNYSRAMPLDTSSRDRILESARRLFHTRSFDDVGVAEICADAGVKKGSFYHFFPSKQELALAMLDAYRDEWGARLHRLVTDEATPPLALLARLPLLIAETQEAFYERHAVVPGCPFGNMSAEMSTRDEVIRARVAEVFGRVEALIEQLLRRAMAQGDLAQGDLAGIDPAATARAMFAYLEGVILSAKTRNDPAIIRQLGPAMVSLRLPPPA